MTRREIVLDQIHHRETSPVPYTLGFEPEVEEQLAQRYGTDSWRDRLLQYIVSWGAVERRKTEAISRIRCGARAKGARLLQGYPPLGPGTRPRHS